MINGHRLILLSPNRQALEDELELVGADRVERLEVNKTTEKQILGELAENAKSGVVMLPSQATIPAVIASLESELPWVQ